MTIFECLGFFYVSLATALFTAGVLGSAGFYIYHGFLIVRRRYRSGYFEELKDLNEQAKVRDALGQ